MIDQCLVITGACGHIGQLLCKRFLSLGYFLYCLDLEDAFSSFEFFDSLGSNKVFCIPTDLRDTGSISIACETISKDTESLQGIINNAAYYGDVQGFDSLFEDETYEAWDQVFKVNAFAPFFLIQRLYPLLRASVSSSSIVNIGTMYTRVGPDYSMYEGTSMTNPCSYSASKSALEGLTRWLSTTLSPSVRANMISPGGVFRNQDEVFQERYLNKVPLKRFCTEDDVVNLSEFLISDQSSYITGQNILLDGGYTIK
tara:strand:+ start:681 stop:1448 length:768 start_codon:yes stop_codon:yes gene_type:complete